MKKIVINNRLLAMSKEEYSNNGTPAISLYLVSKYGIEPYMDLTVNTDNAALILGDNEILVKAWSENEPYLDEFLKSKYFEDTGKRVPVGYVDAQVWKVLDEITGVKDLNIEDYLNSELSKNEFSTILYGVTENETGYKCRFVQCGFDDENGFTGIIVDSHGGGIFAREFYKNSIQLKDDLDDCSDYDVFISEVEKADEIIDYFTDLIEENDDGCFYINDRTYLDEFKHFDSSNYSVHENDKYMKPFTSLNGNTKIDIESGRLL